jgi:hypothetical protein
MISGFSTLEFSRLEKMDTALSKARFSPIKMVTCIVLQGLEGMQNGFIIKSRGKTRKGSN